ncbi:serine hydrolase [Clostridium frigidicarnis]|uniref:CubicO group peptidase, beta-lactamase class C family n=1 Tax=Clostridium frigidicarnis TaxID=84698 RepID=A0A1I0X5X2_9CLOT|nr:serine hydrolase [Clostridium frigidicarnis]SFA96321.1 CubicO group peptidase, beta-lactamase class C family [Clostridium frigidicarnis]
MKKKINKILTVILCCIVLVCTKGNVALALTEQDMKSKDISNSKDVQEFMDKFFTSNMQKYKIPGSAVVVVKDGKEVFKKGYGYSNLDKKIEVNPDETLFPAASVSKLFTATAIMQLYEQGKIDINENVEKYIAPYKIDNNYNEVITCANLLTHSSGVDEASEINGNTRNEKNIKSQEYYFDNHKPKVVREPNTVSRYSNQGYNILGYVIEKVSGISYEEYIKKNIIEPLKMNNTLVRVKNHSTATGYEYDNGSFNEVPLAYQYTSGSSGINATPMDMENFMLMHLNNGEFEGSRILKEETAKEMKEKQFANNEALPGMGYGFIRSNRNGQEILKHEGGLPGFTTTVFLMPKEKLGIYVATNSLNPLPFNIEDEFLNQFYPQESTKYSELKAKSNKDYSKYEGTYRSYDGISKSNIMKIGFLLDTTMDLRITDNKDGTLTLKEYTSAKEENITKLIEIKHGVFAREDGKGDFAFKLDSNERITYAFNDVSHNSFEKINFYDGRIFNIILFILVIVVFIVNISINILKGIKRLFKRNVKEKSKEIKRNSSLNFIISLLNITGFIGALVLAISIIVTNDSSFIYLLYILLSFLMFSTILSVVGLINIIRLWIKRVCGKRDKIYFTVVTIANIAFIWLIYYFNFLGVKV